MVKLISVVLPTYNGSSYLEQSIKSVIAQTYSNWELIIVDDCSTDDSLQIAKKYEKIDKRIHVIHNLVNEKLPRSLNIGFSIAKGDYFTWTSDDNYYNQNAFLDMITVLESNLESVMVCADYEVIDDDGKFIKKVSVDPRPESMIVNNFCGACFLYRSSVVNNIGGYDESKFLIEDYDFWLRIGLKGTIIALHKNLYAYRTHVANLSHKHNNEIFNKTREESLEFLDRYIEKYPYIVKNESVKELLLIKKIYDLSSIFNKEKLKELRLLTAKNSLYKLYKQAYLHTKNRVYLRAIRTLGFKYVFKYINLDKKYLISKIFSLKKIDFYHYNLYFLFKRYNIYLFNKLKNRLKDEIYQCDQNTKIIVVVPSDKITDYENKGLTNLTDYYNPCQYFDKVFMLSPMENKFYHKYGMTIIGVNDILYKKLIKFIKPSVIRAYGGYWPTSFVINNKINNIPIICSVHDNRDSLLYKEIVFANYVFVTSQAVKNLAISKGVDDRNITIMPDSVDVNLFKKDKNVTSLKEKFGEGKFILSVARRSYEKNIETVIRAISYLPKDYKLIQIGAGDIVPYRNLATSLGVTDRCFFIDSIKNDELVKYYSFADCQCNPSISEGFGIVFIEAGACECAIITSDIAPMNKMYEHKRSAFLVKNFTDPKEISYAILEVCNNDELKLQLGKQARKVVVNNYSKEYLEKKQAEFYSKIIE